MDYDGHTMNALESMHPDDIEEIEELTETILSVAITKAIHVKLRTVLALQFPEDPPSRSAAAYTRALLIAGVNRDLEALTGTKT